MTKEHEWILRPLEVKDIDDLLNVCQDQSLFQYSQPAQTKGKWHDYFRMLASQWSRFGHGAWVVEQADSRRLAGWGGIIIDENDNWGPELVYYVARAYQGQGLASLIARSALSYARYELELSKITAFAHPENTVSNRVLLSQGFERTGFHEVMNRNMYQFRIDLD